MRASYGLDQACDACSESVSPQQLLYKITRAGSDGFVFHSDCFAIWCAERKSMLSVGGGYWTNGSAAEPGGAASPAACRPTEFFGACALPN